MKKLKTLTFSFDDGALQDIRFIGLLDKYGLRATFNLNSGLLGKEETLPRNGKLLDFCKVKPENVPEIYARHEIAAHTLTHPRLTSLTDEEVVRQTEEDRLALERICGRPVKGMAYPCGGTNHDKRVEELIRTRTGIRFARTITSTYSFEYPSDPLILDPSVYLLETDKMFEMGRRFIELQPEKPQLFYVWGHSFEFDGWDLWERMEEFCRMMSGHDDIAYLTNSEALEIR